MPVGKRRECSLRSAGRYSAAIPIGSHAHVSPVSALHGAHHSDKDVLPASLDSS